MRRRFGLSAAILATLCGTAAAVERNTAYDAMIQRHARMHGVPEALVHRVILRESRYNAALTNRHRYFGLMQISYATARSMGYAGGPAGLLDPDVNLTYGVPYLANAYHAAGENESRAIALYAGGYYYVAKRRHMLGSLRTARSAAMAEERAAAPPGTPVPPPANPVARLMQFLAGPPAAADDAASTTEATRR
jgi:soluble lytic murein transglycosylase-like protein